jgi:hypothetical protein
MPIELTCARCGQPVTASRDELLRGPNDYRLCEACRRSAAATPACECCGAELERAGVRFCPDCGPLMAPGTAADPLVDPVVLRGPLPGSGFVHRISDRSVDEMIGGIFADERPARLFDGAADEGLRFAERWT